MHKKQQSSLYFFIDVSAFNFLINSSPICDVRRVSSTTDTYILINLLDITLNYSLGEEDIIFIKHVRLGKLIEIMNQSIKYRPLRF